MSEIIESESRERIFKDYLQMQGYINEIIEGKVGNCRVVEPLQYPILDIRPGVREPLNSSKGELKNYLLMRDMLEKLLIGESVDMSNIYHNSWQIKERLQELENLNSQ